MYYINNYQIFTEHWSCFIVEKLKHRKLPKSSFIMELVLNPQRSYQGHFPAHFCELLPNRAFQNQEFNLPRSQMVLCYSKC